MREGESWRRRGDDESYLQAIVNLAVLRSRAGKRREQERNSGIRLDRGDKGDKGGGWSTRCQLRKVRRCSGKG